MNKLILVKRRSNIDGKTHFIMCSFYFFRYFILNSPSFIACMAVSKLCWLNFVSVGVRVHAANNSVDTKRQTKIESSIKCALGGKRANSRACFNPVGKIRNLIFLWFLQANRVEPNE